jgi:hypothetical protein
MAANMKISFSGSSKTAAVGDRVHGQCMSKVGWQSSGSSKTAAVGDRVHGLCMSKVGWQSSGSSKTAAAARVGDSVDG